MTIILHDLQGSGGERLSPPCWRTQFALWHKGLDYLIRPTTYGDLPGVAGGGYKTLPVIQDGTTTVVDSWDIADYLEKTYPDRPSLFESPVGKSYSRMMDSALSAPSLVMPMFRLTVLDGFQRVAKADQSDFRKSRESTIGCTLEEFAAGSEDEQLNAFRNACQPLRQVVGGQPFFSGERPLYPDYVAVSTFMWARSVSSKRLVAPDDPLSAWLERMLDLFDGAPRQQKSYW